MKSILSVLFFVFSLSIVQADSPLYATYEATTAMREDANNFIEILQDELEVAGYSVEFIATTQQENNAIAHLVFAYGRVRITPQSTLLKDISPVLNDNLPISLTPSHPEIAFELLLYSAGNCEHEQSLRLYAGNCALVNQDYETAIDLYNVRRDAANMAWAYVQLGEQETAFTLLTEALQATDDHGTQIDLLRSRARVYALTFDYDSAISDIDAAIMLDPENPALYVQRGQVVILLYEWDRVVENYNTAIELDPNYAEAYFYRGVLYYSVLDREPALADFENYLELAPEGDLSEQAATYAESIRIELENLSN